MIRTLIVEDSDAARHGLRLLLSRSGEFDVVAAVSTAQEAVEAVARHKPDLVSLDVFLLGTTAAFVVKAILAVRPTTIVLVSDAPRTSDEVFDALAVGAVDLLRKPNFADALAVQELVVRLKALTRLMAGHRTVDPKPGTGFSPSARGDIVAIASSTGGPGALVEILESLPSDFPAPVVIAQHLAEGFETGLVSWLGSRCRLPVRLAESGVRLQGGEVVVGRPQQDLEVLRGGRVQLSGKLTSGYHPSGDVLFTSVATSYGAGAVAVVLSGIGSDGAEGARRVREAHGTVLAQDRSSSVVYGMPAAVARQNLATMVGSPKLLASAILQSVGRSGRGRA